MATGFWIGPADLEETRLSPSTPSPIDVPSPPRHETDQLNNAAESRSVRHAESDSRLGSEKQSENDLVDTLARHRGFTHSAVNAVLKARRLLLLSIAASLAKLGDGDDLISWLYSE